MVITMVIIVTFSPVRGIGDRYPRIIVIVVVYCVLTRKWKTENTFSCSKLCLSGYLQGMFAQQPQAWNKSSMTVPIQPNRSLLWWYCFLGEPSFGSY